MANADRIIELLHEAKARPAGAERERFLAEACRDDAALKEQVVSLIEAEANDGDSDFLKHTPLIRQTALVTEKPGDRIGRYKLLEQIGEGGCGVVYMAEQEEPVRRRVALKVIKLGMDTKQVIARFEAERQALALMDHPNIAKVHDGGATDTGRPFFVMELVRGIKITDYCDQNNLTTEQRLELFTQVCHAVQHAHQKGIIHRDLKPSNILVTLHDGVPVPKVIDFGIAKATSDQRLTDKTLFTAFEQFVGTPAYMSPEQAEMSGLDIDTRSDIYSLGVLLYELLTGKTPFDAKELLAAGLYEMRRTIREVEPVKPSTRLAQELVAAPRQSAADSGGDNGGPLPSRRYGQTQELIHALRGDLDWIVMKCLEKDRTRRYETANGLAMDLMRHLNDEPVMARPPSASYRFRKFAARNKVAMFAGSASIATLLLIVAGLVASNRMIVAQRNEKANALIEKEQALARAEAATERAERNFFRATDTVREFLTITDTKGTRMPPPLRDEFAVQAQRFYESLLQEGSHDSGVRFETAVGYRGLGSLRAASAEPVEAEEFFRRSIAILGELAGEFPANPRYRHQLAFSHFKLGRWLLGAERMKEAEASLRTSVQLFEQLKNEPSAGYPEHSFREAQLAASRSDLRRILMSTDHIAK